MQNMYETPNVAERLRDDMNRLGTWEAVMEFWERS